MSVRKVITRRSRHSRGLVATLKNKRPAEWESQLEMLLLLLLELSPLIVWYEVQPTRESLVVDGKRSSYVPDVLAKYRDGTETFYEVKMASALRIARVAARMKAAKLHFAETHRVFGIVTDQWLHAEPRRTNVQRLMYHRRDPLSPIEQFHFQSALAAASPRTIGELINALGAPDAWRLMGLGVVGVDLERPLDSTAEIYLEGGHRHAHLCA